MTTSSGSHFCSPRRGSVPPYHERPGAAEVNKMKEEQRVEWLDELMFDATMEAYHGALATETAGARSARCGERACVNHRATSPVHLTCGSVPAGSFVDGRQMGNVR
jgi:hypothetical protein